jgi:hypothetical protein
MDQRSVQSKSREMVRFQMSSFWPLFSAPIYLADMNISGFFWLGGIAAVLGVVVLVLVIVTEAIVFQRFGWNWGAAFMDAFQLNVISTIAGCVLYPIAAWLIARSDVGATFLWGLAFGLGFIGSICIEYTALISMRGGDSRADRFGQQKTGVMKQVIIANVCSYWVMIVFGYVAYRVYRGV